MTDRPATRASIQKAISTRLGELSDLSNSLNMEIYELATRAETAEIQLAEARDLAKLALGILDQFPTDPSDFDPSLSIDRLPEWAGGDAETWQRGDGD